MLATDREALECDLMETYGILEYRRLPARRVAVFACGLNEDSRIMRKLSGAKAPVNTMLLAVIADMSRILVWQNTKDGHKGRNRPKSILSALVEGEKQSEGFATHGEFDAWRESMIGENKWQVNSETHT